MRNRLFVILGILGMSMPAYAGPKHSQETSYPSYKGLIMAWIPRLVSADHKMAPIKAMVIMEPESFSTRSIAQLMYGRMSVSMKRPMKPLSNMLMEEKHGYSVLRINLPLTSISSG